MKECDNDCSVCQRILDFKNELKGNLFPPPREVKKLKVQECLIDSNSIDHGFCVLKVSKNMSHAIQNQAWKMVMDKTEGMKFDSFGQEEKNTNGKRETMNLGKELCSKAVIKKGCL